MRAESGPELLGPVRQMKSVTDHRRSDGRHRPPPGSSDARPPGELAAARDPTDREDRGVAATAIPAAEPVLTRTTDHLEGSATVEVGWDGTVRHATDRQLDRPGGRSWPARWSSIRSYWSTRTRRSDRGVTVQRRTRSASSSTSWTRLAADRSTSPASRSAANVVHQPCRQSAGSQIPASEPPPGRTRRRRPGSGGSPGVRAPSVARRRHLQGHLVGGHQTTSTSTSA